MGLQKFLKVTLFFFLALVAESFSLRSPHSTSTVAAAGIRAPQSPLVPGKQSSSSSLHPNLRVLHQSLVVRGGQSSPEDEVIDLDAPPAIPEKSGIMSALDATGLTTALVNFGQIYSKSLETWPIATKSVTVSSTCL